MKHEKQHEDRVSINIYVDSEATKTIYDKRAICLEQMNFKGFLQEISQNPFGLFFITPIQVNL